MFVNVVASIQYRALADKANDAFYKLSNTRSQIQAYVFDGILLFSSLLNLLVKCVHVLVKVFNFFSFLFVILCKHAFLNLSNFLHICSDQGKCSKAQLG